MLTILMYCSSRMSSPAVPLPPNVKVHAFTLAGFSELASRTLGIPIQVPAAFKLCDFRPAYGVIFHEYLSDYAFWAFGDLDVIYGDVARFLGPLLDGHDIISCRKGWISGSLCVLRNCSEVNSAFLKSADWERVFTTPANQLFDELGAHLYKAVSGGADVLALKGDVDSFTHVVKRLERDGVLRCSFQDMACENLEWGETLIYDHGRINRASDGAEVMYVHTVLMKRRFFFLPDADIDRSRFHIRKTGIYPVDQSATARYRQEVGRIFRGGSSCFVRLVRRVAVPKPPRRVGPALG